MKYITSCNNKFFKSINLLKLKKEREKTKLFLVEGEKSVLEIPKNWIIESYILSKSYVTQNGKEKSEKMFNRANIYIFSDELFKKASDTKSPQGIIAVCRQKNFDLYDILNVKNNFFVMLENISDPGNLGTIIRTSDAAGVSAVLISNGCVDIYNNKVIRSTMGSIFHIPIIERLDFNDTIMKLHQRKIKIFSAHLKGSKSIYDIDFTIPCAIIIGNEANGITDKTASITDELIKIPILGKAESINASVAGGIIIYEAARQRIIN